MEERLWRDYVADLSNSIPFPYGSFPVCTPCKCEIVLGVRIALCGIRSIDLRFLRHVVEEYGRPYGVIVDEQPFVQFFTPVDDDDDEK